MSFVLAVWLVLQGAAPLRKSDLVRLLSGSVMSQQEIAQLVSRNCLTFAPTDRDRSDFRRLGAEAAVLAAIDGCARRTTRPALASAPVVPPPVLALPSRSLGLQRRHRPPPPPCAPRHHRRLACRRTAAGSSRGVDRTGPQAGGCRAHSCSKPATARARPSRVKR